MRVSRLYNHSVFLCISRHAIIILRPCSSRRSAGCRVRLLHLSRLQGGCHVRPCLKC